MVILINLLFEEVQNERRETFHFAFISKKETKGNGSQISGLLCKVKPNLNITFQWRLNH